METLAFVWITVEQLTSGGSPFRSKSALYAAVRASEWPQPTRIGGRSLWKSDEVDAANRRLALKAEAEREERALKASQRAERLLNARRAAVAA